MDSKKIQIEIQPGEVIDINLFPIKDNLPTLWKIDEIEARENGEAVLQVLEGFSYEYEISNGYQLPKINQLVIPSKASPRTGRIEPGLYVGTIKIPIHDLQENYVSDLELEVRSLKTSYRDDYRFMLEEIANQCTSLILKSGSPTLQMLSFDFSTDFQTMYQRFAFLQSFLTAPEFNQAVHRILAQPVSTWRDTNAQQDIRSLRRISGKDLRKLAGGQNRYPLSQQHPLRRRINSLPTQIETTQIILDTDTPENRFVKFALSEFLGLCTAVKDCFLEAGTMYSKAAGEASALEEYLSDTLNHSFFRHLSYPETLPLNSPVLQRKEGYRDVLRIWLLFDVAARLIWSGGDDVYTGGKRDVARLYEYWLFFILKDLVEDVFSLPPAKIEDLFTFTDNGLDLKLKAGKQTIIKGVYENPIRKLQIEFSYNKTFSGNSFHPQAGSWSRRMRPDYTLSLWPEEITKDAAEIQELITHIHFDAKYRISNLTEILGEDLDQDIVEPKDVTSGNYQRNDLLKMHAYKDAIRRTAGAYILYPGEGNEEILRGFHEIIPGLGAFAIRPSMNNNGTTPLKSFLENVAAHLLNRAAQREQLTYHTYNIFKNAPGREIKEPIPEFTAGVRTKPPQDTIVLIGYCKSEEHYVWIIENGLYNFRLTGRGAISKHVDPQMLHADYILLHWKDHQTTGEIYQVNKRNQSGPVIMDKSQLIDMGYPAPGHDTYLVFEIMPKIPMEFQNIKWNIKNLIDSKEIELGFPRAISLLGLMSIKI